MIDEDWLLLGMIHAFRSLSIVRKQGRSINNVDFEYLIEIQKRNLSDPHLADSYQKFIVNMQENSSLEEMR